MNNSFQEVVDLLERAQQKVVNISQEKASEGKWDHAKQLLDIAQELDRIRGELQVPLNGVPKKVVRTEPTGQQRPQDLPYYFIEYQKLVKVGPSRDGTTYRHRVPKKNFDLVANQLKEFAGRGQRVFETRNLVDQCQEVPRHEPLIVLRVLEEQGLVKEVRRGRWEFVHVASFAMEVAEVWSILKRKPPV